MNSGKDCSICLMPTSEHSGITLCCKQSYHIGCIYTWLQINKTCTICRLEFSDKVINGINAEKTKGKILYSDIFPNTGLNLIRAIRGQGGIRYSDEHLARKGISFADFLVQYPYLIESTRMPRYIYKK